MTWVVAHRGASGHAPENTMRAFRLAAEMGADAIELDVHRTADGELAVIHDDTLDRTTDRTGAVASLAMAEIREANAGDGEGVPTLGEVLAWLPDDLGLVVEIKARAAVDEIVAAVSAHDVHRSGRASIISFDEASIERVRELDPTLTTGYLLVPGQPIPAALEWATQHGHAGVHPWEGDLGLDPAPILAQAMAYGRRVGCYVVDEPDRMKHLAAYGLWGFVTNLPDVGRTALGPRGD
jgi:glycerophosphoryl diester phosphodiesterase